ncbi:Mlo14p [Orobanche hederae]
MLESNPDGTSDNKELRSLGSTPTWSVASVLTAFIVVSLLVERSIHRLSHWLKKTNRKPLQAAVEKMKEELMLLENYEPFVSHEGLEQLHRFIFVMAVTHISYSCLTMLLAIIKIHNWRVWENEAHIDIHNSLHEITRTLTMQRQSSFVRVHVSSPTHRNRFLVWVTCFFRQFGRSVVRADYLALRQGFIANHNLTPTYDFHSYMIRSMEEEFQMIVGVSAPLWGFVIAFMLFNVKGSNLYFWIALIPVVLVLLVGTKLQHVIATLALESVGISENYGGPKFKLRDELFWFNKPELLLSLIHFILFQNAFELASFFWFWWQFGYNSCFIKNHFLVYLRLVLGFTGQFLCSYSTLPLYALVTQMGSKYKAALIPQRIRETIHGWKKAARRRRRLGGFADDSTVHPDSSTMLSVEEYDDDFPPDTPRFTNASGEIELQKTHNIFVNGRSGVADATSSQVGTPLLRPSASISLPVSLRILPEIVRRSSSLPR